MTWRSTGRLWCWGRRTISCCFRGGLRLGAFITLNGYRFQVIGVAPKIGRGNNDGDNQKIYIPLSTMLQLFPDPG